jgi:hypothetical protein
MEKNMLNLKKIFFVMVLFSITNLYAGVKITTESFDHVNETKASGVVLIDGDKVRVDMDSEGGQSIIYDLEKKEVTIINHDERSWIKLTKKQIDDSKAQIKKQMEMIMEQQKAVLQSLPPEQREMVEKQMKEITGETRPAEIKYIKAEKKGKWNNQECEIYDGMADNKKVEELCTVTPKKLKCSIVELDRLKQISTDFAINEAQEGVSAWNNIAEIGVPVIQKSVDNGKILFTNKLVSFQNMKVPLEKFRVPAEYKEIQMPMLNNAAPEKKETPPPPKKATEKAPEKEKKSK